MNMVRQELQSVNDEIVKKQKAEDSSEFLILSGLYVYIHAIWKVLHFYNFGFIHFYFFKKSVTFSSTPY